MYISEYSWGPGPRGTFLIHPTLCPLPFSILGNIFREVLELFSPPPQSLDGRRVRTVPRGRGNLPNRVKRRGSFPVIRRVPLLSFLPFSFLSRAQFQFKTRSSPDDLFFLRRCSTFCVRVRNREELQLHLRLQEIAVIIFSARVNIVHAQLCWK